MFGLETGESANSTAVKATSKPRRRHRKRTPETGPVWRKPADEDQLVERLKNGDEQALEIFFNMYSANLYRVAQRILGEAADTEEVIQDVFWTAYRKAKMFQGKSQFSTWLYRLTINASLGRIRGNRKKYEVAYDEALPKFQKDGHHRVRPVVDWSDTVESRVSGNEMKELLAAALNNLKPVDKAVVVLSDMDGLSDREIAATLNLTISAVKTRLHRARLFLRGTLAAKLGPSAI